jgi:hypothetical protein
MNKKIRSLVLAVPLVSFAISVAAMPERTELEVYDNWKVVFLDNENEYWAYTELRGGYNIALVASNDVAGPGCKVTSFTVFSDVKLLKREDIKASISFGESQENVVTGDLIEGKRKWAPMYSILNISSQFVDELVESAYLSNDRAIVLTLHSQNQFIAKDSGDMSGMASAYNRMIERCQLGHQRKFHFTEGIK